MTKRKEPQNSPAEGARYAVHLLNRDGSTYTTDYHADEVMAEVQGQAWVMFGGGSYRVEKLAVEA